MRRRITGFLLALLLLAVAVPASLGCGFGPPPGGGAHAQPPWAGYAAAVVVVQVAAQSLDGDSAARECADHPAPAQTPYIETSNGGGSRGTVTSRGFNAGIDASAASLPAGTVSAHRYGVAADDTGPPLWLRTCVSRT
jgi:hypothetical protein